MQQNDQVKALQQLKKKKKKREVSSLSANFKG